MTVEQHRQIHKDLDKALDELMANYLDETKCAKLLNETTVMELAKWSHEQTSNPSDRRGDVK